MSISRAVRNYCRDCSGGSSKEVVVCLCHDCPLWPHRLGCGVNSKSYANRILSARDEIEYQIANGGLPEAPFSKILSKKNTRFSDKPSKPMSRYRENTNE